MVDSKIIHKGLTCQEQQQQQEVLSPGATHDSICTGTLQYGSVLPKLLKLVSTRSETW